METIVLGKIGQNIFEIEMLKHGWDLYRPLLENTKVDCIAIKGSVLLKFQIKMLSTNGSLPVRKISHNQGEYKIHHYSENEIDYFIGVDRDTYDIYVIPIKIAAKYVNCIGKTALLPYKNNFTQMELNSGNIINADDDIGECLTANTEGTNSN